MHKTWFEYRPRHTIFYVGQQAGLGGIKVASIKQGLKIAHNDPENPHGNMKTRSFKCRHSA